MENNDKKIARISFLSVSYLGWLLFSIIIYTNLGYSRDLHTAASRQTYDSTKTELIIIAHKILDMGMECGKNGTSRDLCHAALSTAIRKRGY
jgi:hypothetical protein